MAFGAKPDPDLRWSLTGIARLVARENGFAGPLARTHEWRLVAPLAARLLSRHAQSEAGAAAAGAQLLRAFVEANPLKMDRDEILERARAAAGAGGGARGGTKAARRAARPALAGLLATVFDDGRRTSLLSACFKKGDACGAVLDCLGRGTSGRTRWDRRPERDGGETARRAWTRTPTPATTRSY